MAETQHASVWAALRKGGSGLHWSDWLLVAAFCLLPLLAAYKIWANSSGVLKYLAALVLIGVLARGEVRKEAKQFASRFRSPLAMLGLFAIGYAAISSAWAPRPGVAFVEALRTLWIVASAMIVGARLAEIATDRTHVWFFSFTSLALLLLFIEIGKDFAVVGQIYGAPIHQRVNPNVMAVSLLAWPAISAIAARGHRLAGFVLWAATGLMVALAPSGAAVLGFVAGSALAAIGLWSVPVAVWVGAAIALGSLIFVPFLATISAMFMSLLPNNALFHAHPTVRIEIWATNAAAIEQAPIFGIGFRGLAAVHTHNASLQVWVELGVVGVLFAVALILLLAKALLRAENPHRPFAVTCAMAIYANAYVSYGMWEPQWLSIELLVAVAMVWVMAAWKTDPRFVARPG